MTSKQSSAMKRTLELLLLGLFISGGIGLCLAQDNSSYTTRAKGAGSQEAVMTTTEYQPW